MWLIGILSQIYLGEGEISQRNVHFVSEILDYSIVRSMTEYLEYFRNL